MTYAYLIVSAAVVCLINSANPLLQARLPIEAVTLIHAGITTHYIRLTFVMICLMVTSYCMDNKLSSRTDNILFACIADFAYVCCVKPTPWVTCVNRSRLVVL